jgi:sugar lactone lactonase YvrE
LQIHRFKKRYEKKGESRFPLSFSPGMITMIEKKRIFFVLISIIFLFVSINSAQLKHVKNSLKQIEACENKIGLKLFRTWGENDEDENQFFRFPADIKVGKDGLIYISDSGNCRIGVFDRTGGYRKTIGRKGLGPGDLLAPGSLAFDSRNNLVVADSGNRRIQVFDQEGGYLFSFKTINASPSDIAVSENNEIAVHSHQKTFASGSLVTLYNSKGKVLREIGKLPYKPKSISQLESFFFTMDKNGHFIISSYAIPYFRKYSYSGKSSLIVSYETYLDAPRVEVNGDGAEPVIKGKIKNLICAGLTVDGESRIYLAVAVRQKKKSERFFLVGGPGSLKRFPKTVAQEKTDMFRLLVFSPEGSIIASAKLNVFCDKIYVFQNRLFVIDCYMTMKIYEYEMTLAL